MTGQTVSALKPQPIRQWVDAEDNAMAAQYPLAMDLLFEVLMIPQWSPNATDILVRCAKWSPRGGPPFFSAPGIDDLDTLKTDMDLSLIDLHTYVNREDVQKLAELAIAIGMSYTTSYGFGTCIARVQTILTLRLTLLRRCANENLGSSSALQKWSK